MTRLRLYTLALFALMLASSAHAQFSVLYVFGTKPNDPVKPEYPGIIAQGRDGSLYSTAPQGGAYTNGGVFSVTTSGVETDLYSFPGGPPGADPSGGLTLGGNGNFFGTALAGAQAYTTKARFSKSRQAAR